jgi:hypothetical protein
LGNMVNWVKLGWARILPEAHPGLQKPKLES